MQSVKSPTFLGLRKLPPRYVTIVTPFFLSMLMSGLVSIISTLRSVGWGEPFWQVWPGAWAISWVIAFPLLFLLLPLVRKLTAFVVQLP